MNRLLLVLIATSAALGASGGGALAEGPPADPRELHRDDHELRSLAARAGFRGGRGLDLRDLEAGGSGQFLIA